MHMEANPTILMIMVSEFQPLRQFRNTLSSKTSSNFLAYDFQNLNLLTHNHMCAYIVHQLPITLHLHFGKSQFGFHKG